MRSYLTRKALTVLTLIYSSLNVLAAPEDHGRDYSLDDGGSSMSPVFMVISGIIGIVCASLLIISITKDDKQSGSDKGCLITFFVILIAIAVIGMMSKCG